MKLIFGSLLLIVGILVGFFIGQDYSSERVVTLSPHGDLDHLENSCRDIKEYCTEVQEQLTAMTDILAMKLIKYRSPW